MSVWNETFQSLNLSGSPQNVVGSGIGRRFALMDSANTLTRAAVLSSLSSSVIACGGGLCWDRLLSPLISSFSFRETGWWSSWSISSSEHSFCSYTFCLALAAFNFFTVSNRSTSRRLASAPFASLHFQPQVVRVLWYDVPSLTVPAMQLHWRRLQQQPPVCE